MPRGKGKLGNAGDLLVAALGCGLCCALAAGCQVTPNRAKVEKNLFNERLGTGHNQDIADRYLVACPDILRIEIDGREELGGETTIGPDGRIALPGYGSVRVEGLALPGVAQAIAEQVGTPADRVTVRVVDFASRHLVLVGEVVGRHRTIAYRGSETVLDVLQRVGGITPGAEPTEVYVVRSHIGDLQRPEVFHVDLHSIVIKQDHTTNIRVRPYDQIFVGETRQARIEKCIPPWLRPSYQQIWNMIPGLTPTQTTPETDSTRGQTPLAAPAGATKNGERALGELSIRKE